MIGGNVHRPAEIAQLPGLRELQTLLWIVDKRDDIATVIDAVETARVAANKQIDEQYQKASMQALGRMNEAGALLDAAKKDSDDMLAAARDQAERLTRQAVEHEARCDAAHQRQERLTAEKETKLAEREREIDARELVLNAQQAAQTGLAAELAAMETELKERWEKLRAAMG